MKILELRFKNLNSLYGEWKIDFRSPEYSSHGIFAITGKTGAGKSTILDAICLAFYGATPRLGKITKNSNEIMSRQTSECYAAVIFESQSGTFYCHWGQHRVRKQVDGILAEAIHEISDANTKQIIETKKTLVLKVIEQKIGMDFERFTRSVLLAQGGFDNFLKAEVEEKSKILEQITGTEIYTDISKRVHERQRKEREILCTLESESSDIGILDSEQETKMQQELKESQKEKFEISKQLTEVKKAIEWCSRIEYLEEELSLLFTENTKLQYEKESFEPEKKQLLLAQKAADLEGIYSKLEAIREQQKNDKQNIGDKEIQLPDLQKHFVQEEKNVKGAKEEKNLIDKQQQESLLRIQQTDSLDQRLEEKDEFAKCVHKECEQKKREIREYELKKENLKNRFDTLKEEKHLINNYLQEHSADKGLLMAFTGIKQQLQNLDSIEKNINPKKNEQENIEQDLNEIFNSLVRIKEQKNLQQKEKNNKTKLHKDLEKEQQLFLRGRLLREYYQEQEALLREKALQQKIVDFETERSKLKNSHPCPLCGSTEHPFSKDNMVQTDEIENRLNELKNLIQQVEKLDLQIQKIHLDLNNESNNFKEIEKSEIEIESRKKHKEEKFVEIKNDIEREDSNFQKLKTAVFDELLSLDVQDIPSVNISLLIDFLKDRLEAWQDHVQKKEQFEDQISVLDKEITKEESIIQSCKDLLKEKQSNLEKNQKEYDTIFTERQKLFGDKNSSNERDRLKILVRNSDLLVKERLEVFECSKERLHSMKATIFLLGGSVNKRSLELDKLENEFKQTLEFSGFLHEGLFIQARLTASERERLEKKKSTLDDLVLSLRTKIKDRENSLFQERDKKETDLNLEQLKTTFEVLEEKNETLKNTYFRLEYGLRKNKESKQQFEKKQSMIENQKKEYSRWEKLHFLIGSADGKKYRNFAQGLTFEKMVIYANQQLKKMTDRYLLIRDSEQPLELNVVDNYQGGEVRSTKNLSGGESFIVSLTLALGLSNMASRNVRVDSLFLDEGFGTLDENALEMALEALSGLQQDGKLIGVISHVSALKERIDTQINVKSTLGGKSVLVGPGTEQIRSLRH